MPSENDIQLDRELMLTCLKEVAKEYSFKLTQASSFVSGKNTTDIALCIEAMDIFYRGQVNCFCLVASDSDYTLLAQRFREAGLTVLG